MPEGAFYAWVRIERGGMNSSQIADYLLEKAKVAGIPSAAFTSDDPCVRFSFAAPMEDLLEAARRIRQAVDAL